MAKEAKPAKSAPAAKAASTAKTTAAAPKKSTATKTTAAKAAAPKAAKAAAPKTERKANPALMKPMTPSKELGAVVGTKPLPRTEVVSKVWEYIKSHKLQNPKNGREILADDKLKKVFGTDKVTMFEMNKHLNAHLS